MLLLSYLYIFCVHPPHLETVIHPTGNDPGSIQVEVSTEDLVPVSLNSSEYCDVVFSLRETADWELYEYLIMMRGNFDL